MHSHAKICSEFVNENVTRFKNENFKNQQIMTVCPFVQSCPGNVSVLENHWK